MTGQVLRINASQRRILVALTTPLLATECASPASNPSIAKKVRLSLSAVKRDVATLCELFGVSEVTPHLRRQDLARRACPYYESLVELDVLVELCRPITRKPPAPAPASPHEIAAATGIDARTVEDVLRRLARMCVRPTLPQPQRHAELANVALSHVKPWLGTRARPVPYHVLRSATNVITLPAVKAAPRPSTAATRPADSPIGSATPRHRCESGGAPPHAGRTRSAARCVGSVFTGAVRDRRRPPCHVPARHLRAADDVRHALGVNDHRRENENGEMQSASPFTGASLSTAEASCSFTVGRSLRRSVVRRRVIHVGVLVTTALIVALVMGASRSPHDYAADAVSILADFNGANVTLDGFAPWLANSCVFVEAPTGQLAVGRTRALQAIARWKRAFPDARGRISSIVQHGDKVRVRLHWSGTQNGAMTTAQGTFPPSGRHVSFSAVVVLTMRDGKIARLDHSFDLETVLDQIR